MRILIVSNSGVFVGGIETYVKSLIPHLTRLGHDVGLMFEAPSTNGYVSEQEKLQDLTILSTALSYDQASQWRPDVIYSQGLADETLETKLAEAFPTVRFAHGYSGACISGTKCYSNFGHMTCRRTLGPACLAMYFPLGCGGSNPFTMFALYRSQLRRRSGLGKFRALLVASRHMLCEYRRHGVDENRLHLLPLFAPDVIPDLDAPRPRSRSDRVLFVGRLVALKGALQLVDVVANAGVALDRRLTLVIAGEGREADAIRCQAEARSLTVEFLGHVNAELRTHEMRKADLLLVPSLWPEPFGLVGIEAGCVGLPAAGYLKGGIADWLRPGISGESPPESTATSQGLTSAVVKALAEDEHWNHLRLGAWKTSQEFRVNDHVRKLIKILMIAAGLFEQPHATAS